MSLTNVLITLAQYIVELVLRRYLSKVESGILNTDLPLSEPVFEKLRALDSQTAFLSSRAQVAKKSPL